LDVLTTDLAHFQQRLQAGNHTVKRVLTDPATFDGIGNAYSDEILFAAKLSPLKLTRSLEPDEIERLFTATRQVLTDWISRLDQDVKGFPKSSDITAFRPEFFVHGKYRELCRVCNSPIQRIAGSENEMNYCATCQNGGRIFADRSLSRLLKDDWPKTIEQLMAEP
jgi:formamidopyrimidine-DNA glycosylase